MNQEGIFNRIRYWLFGRPSPKCGVEYCRSLRDDRCRGGNCTQHCRSMLGCNGVCIQLQSGKEQWRNAVNAVLKPEKAD